MAGRKPKWEGEIRGRKVRIYATRSEYWAILDDDDITDPNANVRCYPKVGAPGIWAEQAYFDLTGPS